MGSTVNQPSSNAPQQKRPFQFRLTDALLATAWVAGLLAIVTQVASVDGMPLLVIVWFILPLVVGIRRRLITIVEATVIWGIIGVIVAMLTPVHSTSREAARRTQCVNNLKQISLALLLYEEKYGCLPPAYTADTQGKPMHSWRVLILPFMDQQALYARYNFNEPWDGPNNKKLHNVRVPIFSCLSDGTNPIDTNYVAIVGPGTAWPGATSVKSDMVRDGLSDTILLVEVANSGIHWMEPRDLPVSAVSAGINPRNAAPGSAISSGHPGIVNVAFMDGHIISIGKTTPVDALHALFTIDGGELLNNNGDGFTVVPPPAMPRASR